MRAMLEISADAPPATVARTTENGAPVPPTVSESRVESRMFVLSSAFSRKRPEGVSTPLSERIEPGSCATAAGPTARANVNKSRFTKPPGGSRRILPRRLELLLQKCDLALGALLLRKRLRRGESFLPRLFCSRRVALFRIDVRPGLKHDELPRSVDTAERAVGGGERLVPLLHRAIGDRETRGRVVIVGEIALGLFEHRNGLLGRAERDVRAEAVRIEDGARFGRLSLRGLAFEVRGLLFESLLLSGLVARGRACFCERLVERRNVVAREARVIAPENSFDVFREGVHEIASARRVFLHGQRAVEAGRRDSGEGRGAAQIRKRVLGDGRAGPFLMARLKREEKRLDRARVRG